MNEQAGFHTATYVSALLSAASCLLVAAIHRNAPPLPLRFACSERTADDLS